MTKTMTNELTVLDSTPTDVAIPEPVSTGLELGGGFLKPDELKIVQGTTANPPAGARLGQIYIEGSDEAFDSISVVPIKVATPRALFPEGNTDFSGNVKPICRSFDGFTPDDRVLNKMSSACGKRGPNNTFIAVCSKSKWREANGKKIPPPCRNSYRVLFHVPQTGLPAFFNFKKTAEPVWAIMRQKLIKAIIAHKAKTGETLELFDFWFELSAEKVPGKPYFIPRLKVNRSETGKYRDTFIEYTRRAEKVEEDDVETGVSDALVGGVDVPGVEAEFVNEV